MPTPKARDYIAEGYEAGLRRVTPQVGTIVKGLVEGDERVLLPTTRAQEPGSTSAGYGDSLNDVASRMTLGYAPKDVELLRTPTASQGEGGALGEEEARRRGNTVGIRDQALDLARAQGLVVSREEANLFPTPNTMDYLPARTPEQKAANKGKGGYANVRETVVNELLPTPTAVDFNTAAKSEVEGGDPKHRLKVAAEVLAGDQGELLATPQARDSKGRPGRDEDKNLNHDVARNNFSTSWGKFEPAIRRWEAVLGRPAPAPTKPDGKDGSHRLSSLFTEWLMGLPEGWITDVGLTRNEELKACGNGVVPQQAELALRILLAGSDLIATPHREGN